MREESSITIFPPSRSVRIPIPKVRCFYDSPESTPDREPLWRSHPPSASLPWSYLSKFLLVPKGQGSDRSDPLVGTAAVNGVGHELKRAWVRSRPSVTRDSTASAAVITCIGTAWRSVAE